MKRSFLLLLFILNLFYFNLSAQNTDTIPLSKDAMIRAFEGQGDNKNYVNSEYLLSYAGTNDFDTTLQRTLFDFDLSGIPVNSNIVVARLYLFSDPNAPSWINGHSSEDGTNTSTVYRVINDWDENLVTWNNQPAITPSGQITLPESNYPIEDYELDMTNMIQYMVDNPSQSHGVMLKLKTEEPYRRMVFASSDHEDATLHPKLVVTYNTSVSRDTINISNDAMIRSFAGEGDNRNYNNSDHLLGYAGTNDFDTTLQRTLFNMDLSGISMNSDIIVARLHLFADPNAPSWINGHSSEDGTNTSIISRTINEWNENLVTWNSQPNTTTLEQVTLPESSSPYQDYQVDVTNLIRYMLENPSENHGLMLGLKYEEPYRRMVFASSDHQDPALHPKLVITYKATTNTIDGNRMHSELKVVPNPFNNDATIILDETVSEPMDLKVFDTSGKMIYQIEGITSHQIPLNKNHLGIGLHFYQLRTAKRTIGVGSFIVK